MTNQELKAMVALNMSRDAARKAKQSTFWAIVAGITALIMAGFGMWGDPSSGGQYAFLTAVNAGLALLHLRIRRRQLVVAAVMLNSYRALGGIALLDDDRLAP